MSCTINGEAEIGRDHGHLWWIRADPAVHVSVELLELLDEPGNQQGREFLLATYEVGEACPDQQGARHARRRADQA